jgi:hypothetical protein
MEVQVLKTLAQAAGIGGVALGIFFLILRSILEKNIFPQLARRQAFSILRWIITLSFVVALTGLIAWVTSIFIKRHVPKTVQQQIVKEFSKVTIEEGRIIAEKEQGKIIVLDRGSCLGKNPLFKNPDGTPARIHKISVEVLNLFNRPVSVLEHHVRSRIDGEEVEGYSYKVDKLMALQPSQSAIIEFEASFMTQRTEEHTNRTIDTHQVTEEIVLVTSEGALPPVPVRSIEEPCM